MKSFVIAAILAAASVPVAAHAEDFRGGRIGIVGGWDSVNVDVNDIGTGTTDIDKNYDGATFGILTGYHWGIGETGIFGVGTSTMFSNNSKKFDLPGVPGANNTVKVEAGRDIEVHVKGGVIVSENALLYAKIGYANAKVKAKAVVNGVTFKESDTGSGLRLGVGTEISLNDSFSLMAEYRYTDYSNNLKRNQIVAGIGYKF